MSEPLEHIVSRFAEYAEAERASRWTLGDVAAEAVKVHGKEVIPELAAAARASSAWVKQLIRVSAAFPEELRYPDVPWSFYRAVYNAAKRVDKDPKALLKEALDKDWSQADLAAVGKENTKTTRYRGTCEHCGCTVTVSGGIKPGTKITCPVCQEDLGVME